MIQKPRGTQDYLGDEFAKRREVENKFVEFYLSRGYQGLDTPIFEQKNLFVRSVGEGTDIVSKELFDLEKKSEEVYSLRPEFTAGVIRSLIELGIKSMPLPVKVISCGPCFRYERPQKGRKRQFNQLNIELVGKKSPEIDAGVIVDAFEFLQTLGVEKSLVKINSLGSSETRKKYSEIIKNYLNENKGNLCELCGERLDKNPLRVLDCKNPACQEIIKKSPSILDSLTPDEKEYFDKVVNYLESKKIPCGIDASLVRGLDYYTGVIFEIITEGDESRMNSIGGGGRYDDLIGELDGPDMPAFGMGIGFERVLDSLDKIN